MKLTLEHIDKTISNLDRLMPAKLNKKSTREYSLKEGIFLIAPKLLEKREMGCTTNELVKALAEDEIVIKAATLNHYLCEYQKHHQGETEAQPDQEGGQGGSDSGGEKSGPAEPPANQDKPPVDQERKDTPKEEKPATPGQSAEWHRPESGQSAEKPKPGFGQHAEKLKSEFGQSAEKPKPEHWQSEKRGDHA